MVATMTDLAPSLPFDRVRQGWASLTLARQFSLAGSAVLLAGMLVIGLWVTRQIEEDVTRNTAIATALYVDSVIAPLLPDIRGEDTLPEGARRALDETLSQGALGRRLASLDLEERRPDRLQQPARADRPALRADRQLEARLVGPGDGRVRRAAR